MDVQHYLAPDGGDPFQDWFEGLADTRVRVAVLRGLRVYYAKAGAGSLLLLGGGAKRTQQADIETAVARWKDYRSRR
jgi:putative component of toxin-antitoxin plasmid stabilization module